jgi:hypothetical protein
VSGSVNGLSQYFNLVAIRSSTWTKFYCEIKTNFIEMTTKGLKCNSVLKTDGSNYASWNLEVSNVLIGSKSECMAALGAPPAGYNKETVINLFLISKADRSKEQTVMVKFIQANAVAKGIILEALHEDLRTRYERQEFAKGILDGLAEEFHNATSSAMRDLLNTLRETQCKKISEWRKYVDRITRVRSEIQLRSEPLHEATSMAELRSAIRECTELKAIHAAVCCAADPPTTWDGMVKKMTALVDKTAFEDEKEIKTASLQAIQDSNVRRCYNCDQPGHIARECPKSTGEDDQFRGAETRGRGRSKWRRAGRGGERGRGGRGTQKKKNGSSQMLVVVRLGHGLSGRPTNGASHIILLNNTVSSSLV